MSPADKVFGQHTFGPLIPFTVTVERRPRYVLCHVSGVASLKNYFDLIDEAAKYTVAHGDKLAMVDLREVSGRLGFTDQFSIGEMMVKKLGHMTKVASVVADDPTTYGSVKVANRKGLNLRSFDNEEEAVAWLLDET
jgi:hypothetical protein